MHATNLTKNEKNLDGWLGTRTRDGRMAGTDEFTETPMLAALLFSNLINTIAFHLGRYEPSSPSTQELHCYAFARWSFVFQNAKNAKLNIAKNCNHCLLQSVHLHVYPFVVSLWVSYFVLLPTYVCLYHFISLSLVSFPSISMPVCLSLSVWVSLSLRLYVFKFLCL